MLTKKQKTLLENYIYTALKKKIDENVWYEGGIFDNSKKDGKDSERDDDKSARRDTVMQWLDSDLDLHSVLSYELWPNKDEDSARSLFSKKYRGDDQGKHYEFTPEEINTLYNLRGKYIKRRGLDQD